MTPAPQPAGDRPAAGAEGRALVVPEAYREGLVQARLRDAALAERYVRNTTVGDPPLDALLDLLDAVDAGQRNAWLARAIEGGPAAVPDAPQELRAFFASLDEVPSWWDPAQAGPGCRAFHTHSQMFIGAFVGAVLVEGFATLISKSFSISGGVMDQGVRRLKQNNRHLVEIFMPGGLERQGDGWKLSVRVRLVHAQLRRLIARSPEWEGEAWGTPLSAAHIGYAAASFSALLLQRAQLLGVKLQDGERASFMQVWRRSAQLMGVVPELLFEREADALRLVEVGRLCEPPPSLESCQLANALVHAAPVVAGVEGTRARRALVRKIHRVSRAMIGDEMADALRYPRLSTFGALALMRGANRLQQVLHRVLPGFGRSRLASQFALILDLSHFEGRGLDYRVPGHVHAEKDDRR